MADRAFLSEIRNFRKTKLKSVPTHVTRPDGRKVVEKHTPLGFATANIVSGPTAQGWAAEADLDLDTPEVMPNLLIGGADVAEDQKILQKKGISHILNVATNVPNHFPKKFVYRRFHIMDLPDTNVVKYFKDMFDFIDQGRQRGKILIHGNACRSRAPTIAIAYLMLRENLRFPDALQLVKSKKDSVQPNSGFMRQLDQYDQQLYPSSNNANGPGSEVAASDF